MTKKINLKDLIISQATSTVDELYAKRNALLSMTDGAESELTAAPQQTDQPYDNALSVSESNTNGTLVNYSLPVNSSSLSGTTFSVIKNSSPVKNSSLQHGQLKLTSEEKLPTQLVKNSSPVNLNLPLTGQLDLTSQLNLPTQIIKIIQSVGLSGFGTLAILQTVVGNSGSYIRTRHLARALGMTYQGLLKQIERLITAGYITSPPGDALSGRWLEITKGGQLNLTSQLDLPISSCSSNLNTTTTTNISLGELSLTSQFELTTDDDKVSDGETELTGKIELTSQTKFTGQTKLTMLPAWEKGKLKNNAEDLFYIALLAKIEIGTFSLQTLRLYERISDEKGKDHAAALFLILLPKAKDNPTGYIASAFRQGAEPTSSSLSKIKEMRETLKFLARPSVSLEAIKQQMTEAVSRDDTQALTSLVQVQTNLKRALQLLSWNGTLEALLEKRDEFISSLLK